MAFSRFDGFRGRQMFVMTPVTISVIAFWILTFLLAVGRSQLPYFLAWDRPLPMAITGLFTHVLVMPAQIITLLFAILMMFMFGGSLERTWGPTRFLLFTALASAASAGLFILGMYLLNNGNTPILAQPWFLISAVIVAWAWLNPEETILLWFVIPLRAKWIGWLTIVILYFNFAAAGGFLLGFFALGGIAAATAFVHWQRTWGWVPRRRESRPAKPRLHHPASRPLAGWLRPLQEWQRRRRVAKLQRTFRLDD